MHWENLHFASSVGDSGNKAFSNLLVILLMIESLASNGFLPLSSESRTVLVSSVFSPSDPLCFGVLD